MPDANGDIINRNFADIFSGSMRYVIPFFQRGYAWSSKNWNQLKQDIEDQILEPAQTGDLAEQEHFFGPVVVAEKSGTPASRCSTSSTGSNGSPRYISCSPIFGDA